MNCLFRTRLNRELNRVEVTLGNDHFYNSKELYIKILDGEEFIFMDKFLMGDYICWLSPSKHINDFTILNIEIIHNETIIFKDFHRIRSERGDFIQPQAIFIHNIGGMGDTYFVEPVIRKLSLSYGQKIRVYTYYPELFINNPYVDSVVKVETHHSIGEYEKNIPLEDRNKYHIFYCLLYYRTYNGDVPPWTTMDFRQLAAIQCGFFLKKNEMYLDFYPNPFVDIPELPKKYVCINPAMGSSSVWNKEKWQELVDKLNDVGIYVVVIGKDVNSKTFIKDLNIRLGIDLSGEECQNNLSQVWHIIDRCDLFISPQNCMSLIGSTTDSEILVLGGIWDLDFQLPYRNGGISYKTTVVGGECEHQHCRSNVKNSVMGFGTTNFEKIEDGCYLKLDFDNIKCFPSVDDVFNKVNCYAQ